MQMNSAHHHSNRLRTSVQVFALSLFLIATGCGSAEEAKSQGMGRSVSLKGVKAIDEFIAGAPINKGTDKNWKTRLPTPPKVAFDSRKTYYWLLETNIGSIKVKLFADTAPMHVSSTIYLTRLGFYDDIIFHRVIPGFMAQGGDPTGTGRGGPGYRYAGEFEDGKLHDKAGVLSMANSGPNTDASQFFLTFRATPHLNGKHTVFGNVVEGMATVKELEKNGTRGAGTPKKDLFIKRATIIVE
jgi:cyclophilin family peptidyl-prolyl cis-trans isomerase